MRINDANPNAALRPAPGGQRGPLSRLADAVWPWFFAAAGCALLAAAVLIPAERAARDARWLRDRAVAVEVERLRELEAHRGRLDAIERGAPAAVREVVRSQLGLVPRDRVSIVTLDEAHDLPGLLPVPQRDAARVREVPRPAEPASRLADWANGPRSRLWLLLAGGLCLLIGLLPENRHSAD